jgi:hypothetical protein
MVDTVTSQVIINGPRNLIMKFTNESDGTGESGVTKVNAGTLGTGVHLTVARIIYAINSGSVRVMWNATAPTDMDIISGFGTLDYTFFGGLPNPMNTGADGSINVTTVGFTAGSSYTITLEMIKNQ